MKKIAFLFPGQGAQCVGMGKDFYDNFEVAKAVFDEAKEVTGLDIADIAFTENDKLNQTEYTQIAMLTVEMAILKVLKEKGITPDVCAGLSLGEYGALAAAEVMNDRDLYNIVRKRGIYMQEAYPVGGAMSAVIGLDIETIEKVCSQVNGYCAIANYNCPGQIVITGEEDAVKEAGEKMVEEGALKCVPLKVSGPFHSKFLVEAGKELAKEIDKVEISSPKIPYITNVTADYVTSADIIPELLEKQISSSVKWQQTMERMIQDGIEIFVEVGPGKTLSGFMKKIKRSIPVYNVDSVTKLEQLCDLLLNNEIQEEVAS